MQSIRDILKQSLAHSLDKLSDFDRLNAAWPVACGIAVSNRGTITGYHDRIVEVAIDNPAWLDQFLSMRLVLERELAKIAQVEVAAIHFHQRKSNK